jgi:hypothetical protein
MPKPYPTKVTRDSRRPSQAIKTGGVDDQHRSTQPEFSVAMESWLLPAPCSRSPSSSCCTCRPARRRCCCSATCYGCATLQPTWSPSSFERYGPIVTHWIGSHLNNFIADRELALVGCDSTREHTARHDRQHHHPHRLRCHVVTPVVCT